MYGREELSQQRACTSWGAPISNTCEFVYVKDEADKVMDAMEARIKELESQSPKWNSVKNGVPTHYRAVAIYPPFKGCEFACYNEFECCWDAEDGDDYLCELDEVEMWFEIPLPPTTEEK